MKSVRIRSDFTVKLPEELRKQVRPGDTLGVLVSGGRVTYLQTEAQVGPPMREIIDRIRSRPAAETLTEPQIESIIHRVRRRRR